MQEYLPYCIQHFISYEIVNASLPYKRPCRILPWLIPIIRSRLLISCSAATRASIVNSLSSSSSSIPSLSYTSSSGIASYSLLVPYHIHTNFNIRHTAPNFLQTAPLLLPHQQHRPHSLLHLRMAVNLYLDYWRDLSFLYAQEITSKIVIVRCTRLVLNTMHACNYLFIYLITLTSSRLWAQHGTRISSWTRKYPIR